MLRRTFLMVAGGGLVFPFGTARAAEDKPPAEVIEPADKSPVAPDEDISGRLNAKGWPVVVIKPLVRGQPWYCQREVKELTADGKFSAKATLGDAKTPKGTSFRIAILVVASKEIASKDFPRDKTLDVLPAALPKSRTITVKLE